MIIEISVAVIAFAFVILVIYLITMIKALNTTLGQVNQTLSETRKQMDELGGQALKVIEHTNQISYDVKKKIEAIDPVFNAVEDVGEILEHHTSSLKKEYISSDEEESLFQFRKKELPSKKLTTVAAILELGAIGFELWQKLKKRR